MGLEDSCEALRQPDVTHATAFRIRDLALPIRPSHRHLPRLEIDVRPLQRDHLAAAESGFATEQDDQPCVGAIARCNHSLKFLLCIRTPSLVWVREVEAEAVALVCLEALGLPGADHCRGYIQHWNQHRGAEPISERSAQRIFKAADQILKAGAAAAGEVLG